MTQIIDAMAKSLNDSSQPDAQNRQELSRGIELTTDKKMKPSSRPGELRIEIRVYIRNPTATRAATWKEAETPSIKGRLVSCAHAESADPASAVLMTETWSSGGA
jgi:hypothetical protein